MSPKHPGGRPTDYRPAYCERVIEMGKKGLSLTRMAAELDIAKENFDDWRKRHEEFRLAVMRAIAFSEAWWEECGQKNMLETRDRKINDKIWALNMMNRFGWNKKEETTVKGIDEAIKVMYERMQQQKPKISSPSHD